MVGRNLAVVDSSLGVTCLLRVAVIFPEADEQGYLSTTVIAAVGVMHSCTYPLIKGIAMSCTKPTKVEAHADEGS